MLHNEDYPNNNRLTTIPLATTAPQITIHPATIAWAVNAPGLIKFHRKNYFLYLSINELCLFAFNPKKAGGGGAESVPLDISRDKSATRVDLAAPFHDFFL